MSKELVTADFTAQLAEFDKIQETCKKLMATKHYQALGEAGMHAIMARAKALGIHPFEALNGGFHCINGKVGMSTEMMAALVRQRGHSVTKDPKSTNECVILHGKRADNGDVWTCTFSKEDAMAAGLWGTATWKKYSSIMLYNRCMSMLFRQLFPDLSLGAGYVEDELKEIARVGDYKTIDVTPALDEAKQIIHDSKSRQVEVVPESSQVEYVTSAQSAELKEVHDRCEPAFKEKVLNQIRALGIPHWGKVPATMFDALQRAAIANYEAYQLAVESELGNIEAE